MLAFSNDYYGMIFRATQSVELFCAYFTTDPNIENPILLISMVEDVKNIGGSGYVVQKDKRVLESLYCWF